MLSLLQGSRARDYNIPKKKNGQTLSLTLMSCARSVLRHSNILTPTADQMENDLNNLELVST